MRYKLKSAAAMLSAVVFALLAPGIASRTAGESPIKTAEPVQTAVETVTETAVPASAPATTTVTTVEPEFTLTVTTLDSEELVKLSEDKKKEEKKKTKKETTTTAPEEPEPEETTTKKKKKKTTTTTITTAPEEIPPEEEEPEEEEEQTPVESSESQRGDSRISGDRLNYMQQKAMWVTCMTLSELMSGGGEQNFRNNFSTLCQNAKDLGINTLYVHTRAFSDAFYKSDLFVWSRWITGSSGKDPGYDPLAVMVELGHQYGLSVHAWINPYRVDKPDNIAAMPDCTIRQWYSYPGLYPEYMTYVDSTGWVWLNPGIPEVRQLINNGVAEIVSRYDVDGVNIDDYFYPTTDASFDDSAYLKYGDGMSLKEWRFYNCSETVRGMYNTVKAYDPSVQFGVAPGGNVEVNYYSQYADVERWVSEPGFLDYIAPQIYFGYSNQYRPFLSTLSQWLNMPRHSGASMYIGIAPANIMLVSEYSSTSNIIAKQIHDSYSYGADGVALYSYSSLFMPESGYEGKLADERAAITTELGYY
ncbi:MAG: family 10 glycosylhydrolase [Ruminococcus sp.]|nr:family 10 glycosylhydrolase [Ruminococcus sp.]MBR4622855.1 family 10 glycosylhydrolase [Ruminococcus sp.]